MGTGRPFFHFLEEMRDKAAEVAVQNVTKHLPTFLMGLSYRRLVSITLTHSTVFGGN